MILTLLLATAAALLPGLLHLCIFLIVLAIIYYALAWILGAIGAPATILTLLKILCAIIALYYVVLFLLAIVP